MTREELIASSDTNKSFDKIKGRPFEFHLPGSIAASVGAAVSLFTTLHGKSVLEVTELPSNYKAQGKKHEVFLLSATHLSPFLLTQIFVHSVLKRRSYPLFLNCQPEVKMAQS